MEYLPYAKTPVQEIVDKTLDARGIRLLVKREDMNHPLVSGNKWWKLKYNLLKAVETRAERVITFGGAFSNHLAAVAYAGKAAGLRTIGIVRGEELKPIAHENPTLSFALQNGM